MSDASKKARRDLARDHAREMREAERKRRKRNRVILQSSVILGALAVVAVTVLIVSATVRDAAPKPGPLNMLSDGIIMKGDGSDQLVAERTAAIAPDAEPVATDPADYPDTVRIVTYIDYFCPICKNFELANAEQLQRWVSSGAATLEVHPIAILDRASQGTRYASRAANAVACVANFEPDRFMSVTFALFTSQPAEQTPGLTNDELTAVVSESGAESEDVATCIADETFKQWVTEATARTNEQPIPNSTLDRVEGTPTVLVDGIQYVGDVNDAQAFAQFVSAVATGTYVAPTQ